MDQLNSMVNVTSHYEDFQEQQLNFIEADVFIAVEIFIAVFAFTNNALVLAALWKFPKLRNPTNCFVASLAVADIAVAIFAIPSAILLRLGLSVHHAECDVIESPSVGEGTCLVLVTSVLFLTQVSIYSLFLIALDRFIAIHYPYRYSRFMTKTKTRVGIISAWIISGLVILPPLLSWSQWSKLSTCEKNRCRFEEIVSKEYMVYVNFFVCVLLPLVTMCIMYSIIFSSAKKQLVKIYADVTKEQNRRKRTRRTIANETEMGREATLDSTPTSSSVNFTTEPRLETENDDGATSCSTTSDAIKSSRSNFSITATAKIAAAISKSPHILHKMAHINGRSARDQDYKHRTKITRKRTLLRREIHAAKSLATVVGVFALCWLPIHILHTFTLFCKDCKEPYLILDITILLSHANSLMNPIIYAHRLRDFRIAFRKIFTTFKFCENSSARKFRCCSTRSLISTPEFSNSDNGKASSNEPFTEGNLDDQTINKVQGNKSSE